MFLLNNNLISFYLRPQKKELPVSEYKDRSYIVTRRRHVVVVSLISHPYGD